MEVEPVRNDEIKVANRVGGVGEWSDESRDGNQSSAHGAPTDRAHAATNLNGIWTTSCLLIPQAPLAEVVMSSPR
jgi:hypothetical protein